MLLLLCLHNRLCVFFSLQELLNQMNHMSIRPNLLTFNSVLKALRRSGYLSRIYSPQTLTEMKTLGIGVDELLDCCAVFICLFVS